MEKVIVNTIVKNAIRNLKTDPERTIRNLVDMASRFADSRFQAQFYGRIQTLLCNESSAYYALVRDTFSRIDEETLLTFSMNLGYNGLCQGTAKIRRLEEEQGCSIPWTVALAIQEGKVCDRHHAAIRQGESLGIHFWHLFSDRSIHACLDIAACHPDSAFVIFCGPGEADWSVADAASGLHNLALFVPFDKDADTACALLRQSGILYGVHYAYQGCDLSAIESGTLLEDMEQLHPAFCVFMPKHSGQAALRQQVYRWITNARLAQKFSTIPFDLYEDVKLVDYVISEDPIWVGFDACGSLHTELGVDRTCGSNILQQDLTEILKQAFPRKTIRSTEVEE